MVTVLTSTITIYQKKKIKIMTKEQLALERNPIDIRDCENSEPWDINKQYRDEWLAGFAAAEPKWISVEIPPKDDRTVLIKTKDYRRPKDNVTEVYLGYFDQEDKEWYYPSDVRVNSGNGWSVINWMDLPQ
jgi:hypothetical protein